MKQLMTLMVLAMFAFSCEKDHNELAPVNGERSSAKSAHEVCDTPTGNPVEYRNANPGCEIGDEGYEYNSGNINVDANGNWIESFPDGFTGVLSADGKEFTWSFYLEGYCLDGLDIIVKGGPNAFLYSYEGNVTGNSNCESGLISPALDNGNIPQVSHVSLCYNLVACGDVCYDDETAWSDGPRYTAKGNWATYTPYVAGSTVTLYAGQTHEAGTVSFSAVDDEDNVTITIELENGYFLNPDTDESVKIQGYANAPSGNPSPGSFSDKGTSLVVSVAAANFYGVHLDLLIEVDCPEEE